MGAGCVHTCSSTSGLCACVTHLSLDPWVIKHVHAYRVHPHTSLSLQVISMCMHVGWVHPHICPWALGSRTCVHVWEVSTDISLPSGYKHVRVHGVYPHVSLDAHVISVCMCLVYHTCPCPPVLPQLWWRLCGAGCALCEHTGPPATAALPLPARAHQAACSPALWDPALPQLVHLLLERGEGVLGWAWSARRPGNPAVLTPSLPPSARRPVVVASSSVW